MENSAEVVVSGAFERHRAALEESMKSILPAAEQGALMILAAFRAGRKILTCGNGGSAMDAMHFAGSEFLGRYHDDRPPLPAISLVADIGAITTTANDYGYEFIFSRQIEVLGEARDILVVFSTSGKSPNVLRAIEAAKKKEMKVIALTGMKGSALQDTTDLAIVIPSEETARIQEIHVLIYHAWCEFIDKNIFG